MMHVLGQAPPVPEPPPHSYVEKLKQDFLQWSLGGTLGAVSDTGACLAADWCHILGLCFLDCLRLINEAWCAGSMHRLCVCPSLSLDRKYSLCQWKAELLIAKSQEEHGTPNTALGLQHRQDLQLLSPDCLSPTQYPNRPALALQTQAMCCCTTKTCHCCPLTARPPHALLSPAYPRVSATVLEDPPERHAIEIEARDGRGGIHDEGLQGVDLGESGGIYPPLCHSIVCSGDLHVRASRFSSPVCFKALLGDGIETPCWTEHIVLNATETFLKFEDFVHSPYAYALEYYSSKQMGGKCPEKQGNIRYPTCNLGNKPVLCLAATLLPQPNSYKDIPPAYLHCKLICPEDLVCSGMAASGASGRVHADVWSDLLQGMQGIAASGMSWHTHACTHAHAPHRLQRVRQGGIQAGGASVQLCHSLPQLQEESYGSKL
eukprot:scaffold106170_cov19-Tisochrysis_lutea.AAC.1